MTIMYITIAILAVLLYLCVSFVVFMVHTLGTPVNTPPQGFKKIFLAPAQAVVTLLLRWFR